MKKRYAIFCILMSFVLMLSVIGAGCNEKSNESNQPEPEQNVYTLSAEDISLLVGYEFAPDLTLFLNGKPISSTITLSSDNVEYVSVNGGKLKAEKLGQANITAVAKVNDLEVAKATFKCEVKENKGIHPLKSSYSLYISDNVKGVAFDTKTDLNALVYENGAIVENVEIEWTVGDESIAKIDKNNCLTAVSLGETYVVGSYNLGNGQVLKTIELPVTVNIPVLVSTQDLIVDKQKEYQVFNAEEIIGKTEIGVIRNLTDGREYSVTDNYIKTSLFVAGEHTCIFYDKQKTIGVEVLVVSADFVVYNNDDLLQITSLTDGYIALANDLSDINYSNTQNKQFKGVFNGLGHTIKNINYKTSTGLFYNTDGATIKNVAIINATLEKASSGVFMYRNAGGETIIDNTYVSVKLAPGQWDAGGAVAFVFGGKVVYSNSIICSENFVSGGNGMVLGRAYAQLVIKNSFAIGNGPVCGTGSNQYNKNYEAINRIAGIKYATREDLLNAYNKGKVDFSGFNKYWDRTDVLPSM